MDTIIDTGNPNASRHTEPPPSPNTETTKDSIFDYDPTPSSSLNTTTKIIRILHVAETLSSDLKRKRKFSSDSLDSLDETSDDIADELRHIPCGLNAQLVAKNDNRLVKLNILSNNMIRATTKFYNHQTPPSSVCVSSSSAVNDIDDLPSESDVLANGTVLIPLSNNINSSSQHNQTPISTIKSLKTTTNISICYKCCKCGHLFNDEQLFKLHQQSADCEPCVAAPPAVVSPAVPSEITTTPYSDSQIVDDIENEKTGNLVFQKEQNQQQVSTQTRVTETIEISCNSDATGAAARSVKKIKRLANRKQRIYICTQCGIQCHLQSDLNRHMLQMHESDKPFACSGCPMRFFDTASKIRHEKDHAEGRLTVKRSFRCYICSLEFSRASNLRTHVYKTHANHIGKLVHVTKSDEMKLKFEFDIDAINLYKEQYKLCKFNSAIRESPSASQLSSSSSSPSPANNTVIYIKDPSNKNADIQHVGCTCFFQY